MIPTIMTARVTDQHLKLVNVPLIASGGVDVIQIRFEFCDLWDGCGKTAVFYRDPDEVYHVPISDGVAAVPHEVLADEGYFFLGVMGAKSNIRTTEVVRLFVSQGAITEATANHEEPTPDVYQQLLAAYGVLDSAVAVERARIDNLVAGDRDVTEAGFYQAQYDPAGYEFTLSSNGAVAMIEGRLTFTQIPGGVSSTTTIPDAEGWLPLCDTDLSCPALEAEGGSLRLMTVNGLPALRLTNGQKAVEPNGWTFTGEYHLRVVTCAETADIRVDHTGTTHTSAGDAVRAVSAKVDGAAARVVESLCPEFSAKGSAVRCEPVEGYPLNVKSYFGGTFDGEGHAIPWDDFSIELTCAGKNLYNKDAYPLSPGRYILSTGKLTDYKDTSNYAATAGYIPVRHLRGQQITLNHPPIEVGGSNPKMVFYTDAGESSVISNSGTNGYTCTVPDNAVYMRFSVPKAYADGSQIQIELGTLVTAFEAYRAPRCFTADPNPSSSFTFGRGYYEWGTASLFMTHFVDVDGDGDLVELEDGPMLMSQIPGDSIILIPDGSSTIYSDTGDTEVSGRANPGALIDILTRRLDAIAATAVAAVGGMDL